MYRSSLRHTSLRHTVGKTLVVALLIATAASAADWPRFRGPDANGVATEKGLLRSWGDEGPEIVWKRPVGAGFSGVAVVGDRLYTAELTEGEQRLSALDAATGKTLWSTSFGSGFEDEFGNGPRSTPSVDGDAVYAISADLRLLAVAAADGKILWRHDFQEEYGAKPVRFGYGSSPLVDGNRVVVEVGGTEGRSLMAFDKTTGAVLWANLDTPAAPATPIAVTLGGRKQYVFNRRSGLTGLAAETGEVLWEHPSARDTIVMPTYVAPASFFISSALMGDGGHMIRVATGEEGFTAEKVWSNERLRNHFNNSVIVGGHLYGFDNATLRAVDLKTGESRWAKRGYGKGSIIAADGLLFVLSDRGLLALVAATPEAFQELSRIQVMEGRSWTAPTLANGRLYVRDLDELVSLDIRGDGKGRASAEVAAVTSPALKSTSAAPPKTAAEIVARYVKARGGAERWQTLKSLELSGSLAAFSHSWPCTSVHVRGDFYRYDFTNLGGEATLARDAGGLWLVYPLVEVAEPIRPTEDPIAKYVPQLERESMLEPLLIGHDKKGVKVELLGPGHIADRPTVDLKLTLANEKVETWHLDPATWLEVAVDSEVYDFSQGPMEMTQRVFYSDFRDVEGVVLPHQMAIEFGARLEEITVESVKIDVHVDEARYAFPGGNKEKE
jgi:outer membrane protein assembly factor BamB